MINETVLEKFIEHGLAKLTGDWLIIGGSVIPLVDKSYRVTLDIDVAKIGESSNDSQLELMQVAEDIGLPVEAVNSAAAFFINKIKDVEKNIILVQESEKTKIFRPNFYLYIKLKSSRLSETDLLDCIKYLEICRKRNEELQISACIDHLKLQLAEDDNIERLSRRKKLINRLSK